MNVRNVLLAALIGLHAVFFVVLADARQPASSVAFLQTKTVQSLSKVIDMSGAILERKELLSGSLKINYVSSTQSGAVSVQTIALKDNPLWIIFQEKGNEMHAGLDAERIRQHLISYPPEGVGPAQSCSVTSMRTDEEGVLRAETDCIARSGYSYDVDALAQAIKNGFESRSESIEFALTPEKATVTDASGTVLTVLGTGHSTFEGSGLGRKSNVRKGLNERVHNVVVPAGAVFSFNDTLGIVSTNRGWQMALTIFEGVNLRPAPGGGICQVSTTTYRAALEAGFPIIEQKNHSMYVTYYEKYGVGQDATIFPGKQNMKFLNDSGGPLVIQAYNDGDEAYVHLYGIDDGRHVVVAGPYFSKNMREDESIYPDGKKLKVNEIGWVRTVVKATGEEVRDVFVARYNALPKSLASRSKLTVEVTREGNAPQEVAIEQ